MTDINISTTNDPKPLPICIRCRESLINDYHIIPMIVLEYFEAKKASQTKNDSKEPISHLLKCPKCIKWLHDVTPKDILSRQKRITEYCCASMYCAVEETKSNDIKISFTMYRNEDPCWMIEGKDTFISFCPWCGLKLPDVSF